jgi:hypothetical protein
MSKQALRLIIAILFVGMILGAGIGEIIHLSFPTKIIKPERVIVVRKDTLCYNDSIILAHLKCEFKKREGFSPEEYPDDHGNWFIGYGHKTVPGVFIKSMTEEQASDLLWKDEIDRYWIIRSLEKKHLHDKLFQLFTTGMIFVK